jgi:putative endonuclease
MRKQGMRLIARNYHCRAGEIDLIMQHQNILVFVEVRFRRSNRYGTAAETVNHAKQRRIIHTAEHFLQQHNTAYSAYRFDVVGVSPMGADYDVEWIQNAFQL